MLDLFRRQRQGSPPGPGNPTGGGQRSHIFPKFLKRLVARDRPTVLDLGKLSGDNIEIFARLGCRVQVEDLVTGSADHAHSEPAGAAPLPALPETAPATGPRPSVAGGEASAPPAPAVSSGGSRPSADGAPPTPGGARPSRRIVLPPRTFGRPTAALPGARPAPAPVQRTPLATRFAYDDDAFDGIVAWDLFNYYDPPSARDMAADVARLLKPGGLVFAYLHSRPTTAPDGPVAYRILDESRIEAGAFAGRPLPRHVYQNRDIEKMFTGLRIVELYFMKSGIREMLLEKRAPATSSPPAPSAVKPRSRFRID